MNCTTENIDDEARPDSFPKQGTTILGFSPKGSHMLKFRIPSRPSSRCRRAFKYSPEDESLESLQQEGTTMQDLSPKANAMLKFRIPRRSPPKCTSTLKDSPDEFAMPKQGLTSPRLIPQNGTAFKIASQSSIVQKTSGEDLPGLERVSAVSSPDIAPVGALEVSPQHILGGSPTFPALPHRLDISAKALTWSSFSESSDDSPQDDIPVQSLCGWGSAPDVLQPLSRTILTERLTPRHC